MKKIDLSQIITILANVGVLAGIVFVALEIRQSNRIAIGTTSYELNRNWMDLNEIYMTSPDVVDLLIALSDENFVPKDDRQREQAEAYARRILNHWVAIEEAHDNGIASDAFYQMGVEDVIAKIRERPGVLLVFETVFTQYDMSRYEMLEPLFAAIQERQIRKEEPRKSN